MEASIGQLKKDKQSSLSELKKLQADMTSTIQKIKVMRILGQCGITRNVPAMWNHIRDVSVTRCHTQNVSAAHAGRFCWPSKWPFLVAGMRPNSVWEDHVLRQLGQNKDLWADVAPTGRVVRELLESTALGSSLSSVVGRVRAGAVA
jgi:hypothetical protein